MSLPRAETLMAEYMRFLERELDRLQATADRRGELLRRAGHALTLKTALSSTSRANIVAAIVAEMAGEGEGS